MTRIGTFLRRRDGIAATEFALVAPLLVVMLGVTVELGRMLIAYRQFEQATIGVARHVTRYPEYEKRARDHAPAVAGALFRGDGAANMDLQVASLTRKDGAIAEVFPPHLLLGKNPGLSWRDFVRSEDFYDGEAIVFVAAAYRYTPLFLPNAVGMTFQKTVTTLPMFSRTFPWNDGTVEDKYVW